MFAFLLILLILDGLLLTVVILLQAGKGEGLAAMGGSGTAADSLIGGRQAATLLTKATWIGGGIFLTLALVLSILSTRSRAPSSILRDEFRSTQTAPAPIVPGTTAPAAGTQPAVPGTEPQGAAQPPATTTTND